jgi:hypothetical protein
MRLNHWRAARGERVVSAWRHEKTKARYRMQLCCATLARQWNLCRCGPCLEDRSVQSSSHRATDDGAPPRTTKVVRVPILQPRWPVLYSAPDSPRIRNPDSDQMNQRQGEPDRDGRKTPMERAGRLLHNDHQERES